MGAANPAVQTLGVDLEILSGIQGADLVHSHTWYANMAGHLAALLHGIPHVLSAHSLEPLRPWKAEQLGGGYALSSWVERTAYEAAAAIIAVSHGMRADILRCYPQVDPEKVKVVHNGIDVDMWQRDENDDAVRALGIDPHRPSVVFVGRNTRQKGVPYLLRAADQLPPEVQLVLCLGAADTPELAAETNALIDGLKTRRDGVVLIERMLPRHELIQVLSHATGLCVPLGLRAAGHRQPRSHGLRRGSRGQRYRRHPRGRRGRRHRNPGSAGAGAGRHRHSAGPRRLRPRLRRSADRDRQRPGPRQGAGRGGPPPGRRAFLLDIDRRQHARGVPQRPAAGLRPPRPGTATPGPASAWPLPCPAAWQPSPAAGRCRWRAAGGRSRLPRPGAAVRPRWRWPRGGAQDRIRTPRPGPARRGAAAGAAGGCSRRAFWPAGPTNGRSSDTRRGSSRPGPARTGPGPRSGSGGSRRRQCPARRG
ncbi:glycogen synthase [Arthrobacter crystallopoietes BAB-32]|uniref:Glycogen synthase n=1 Tax=Arthrobacter crystallopoietes BAB-32 TaxID=1246476 RepID=N1UR30_9MICC|nr:glycogen synthase [Arthrobacter crystallopoietes BAB-32]